MLLRNRKKNQQKSSRNVHQQSLTRKGQEVSVWKPFETTYLCLLLDKQKTATTAASKTKRRENK